MASTLLEQMRQRHEDIEMLENAMLYNLHHKPKSHRERLLQDNRVRVYLTKIHTTSKELLHEYDDAAGLHAEEQASMKGDDVFKNFYEQLTEIRDYHAKFPKVSFDASIATVQQLEPNLAFSGEEVVGRFMDLTRFHERFSNFPGVRMDYQTYLDHVKDFAGFPRDRKNQQYREYVEDIVAYLRSFFQRTQPLVELRPIFLKLRKEFETNWPAGKVPGWGAKDSAAPASELYCAVCNKRFSKESVMGAHMASKKHKRRAAKNGGVTSGVQAHSSDASCAWAEVQATRLFELLNEKLEATKRQVEKKQTRTYEELEAEMEAAEAEGEAEDSSDSDSDDEDEEQVLYNPKNLPLGWDGKPIPYWLYKLHGLNMTFKCEICRNHSYRGRRDFDRHFREWRHAQGMKLLGIPNTKHFHDITDIDDAKALYAKLKASTHDLTWDPKDEEEFEDSEGNVLSRKMYEDMVRQGIL